jgi:hypothetical protein
MICECCETREGEYRLCEDDESAVLCDHCVAILTAVTKFERDTA